MFDASEEAAGAQVPGEPIADARVAFAACPCNPGSVTNQR